MKKTLSCKCLLCKKDNIVSLCAHLKSQHKPINLAKYLEIYPDAEVSHPSYNPEHSIKVKKWYKSLTDEEKKEFDVKKTKWMKLLKDEELKEIKEKREKGQKAFWSIPHPELNKNRSESRIKYLKNLSKEDYNKFIEYSIKNVKKRTVYNRWNVVDYFGVELIYCKLDKKVSREDIITNWDNYKNLINKPEYLEVHNDDYKEEEE